MVVLELPQENRDDGVAGEVSVIAAGQEDVCLVEEKDATPCLCQLEDFAKVCLHDVGFIAELAGAEHVEWALYDFCYCLGCEGFAFLWVSSEG